jgi:predicted flap endonuclease-1-like 5' DNA nuclease
MNYPIEKIEGIGARHGAKLKAAGIKDTLALLEACGTAKGRTEVAAATGLDASLLLHWANRADLMRVSGVGEEFSDLLEAAGVDTVKELCTRNADNLAAKIAEVNQARKLTRALPPAARVADWIEQAKKMEPKISH